jgi:UDP-glucose 4-epimerase
MRYLITGGAGFIGSHLADALAARDDQILILDDLSTGRRENIELLEGNGRVEFVRGSVVDEALVDECMASVDACFHLASTVGVKLVVSQPLESLLDDVRGIRTVAEAAARHKVRKLFTSTSEIYGKRSDGYVHEGADRLLGSPSTSRWNYSTAKSFGEALVHGYHHERGAEMVTVRIFNTVGPRQAGAYGMVLPRFVSQALSGASLTVYGDGQQSRCFVHVADTVDALIRVMESDAAMGETFNIGCDAEIRIVELAERVIARSDSRSRIRYVRYEEAYGEGFEELGCRKPDTTKLREATGWEPSRAIDDAIDDTVAHQRRELGVPEVVT